MSFIVNFLEDIVDERIDYIEDKIIEYILPSNLSNQSKQQIAIIIKNDPKISSKIMRLKSLIYTQLQLGSVMFVNALIGLIPIPIIPGLIRTANNIVFQMFKTYDRINDFREITENALQQLNTNTEIKILLENSGINVENINQPSNKDDILNKVEKSARKAFEKIDGKYLEDVNDKLTPTQIYDKINKLASKKNYQNKTTQKTPLPLPPPKTTQKTPLPLPPPKTTQKAGRKNKKQKKYYKKRTKRIKHKK
jgi:hypothetical protein